MDGDSCIGNDGWTSVANGEGRNKVRSQLSDICYWAREWDRSVIDLVWEYDTGERKGGRERGGREGERGRRERGGREGRH